MSVSASNLLLPSSFSQPHFSSQWLSTNMNILGRPCLCSAGHVLYPGRWLCKGILLIHAIMLRIGLYVADNVADAAA